eukprot:TRINITY_DN1678_c0_g1_i1.p1 TRINITY_DN1678_c0_g1~~TRINITY_DN1678_c0_g1_i1.p1  ORF type:complete len:299 (+),score=62.96 TRINITY_DN1678_c0_g1_i1:49-897(+)
MGSTPGGLRARIYRVWLYMFGFPNKFDPVRLVTSSTAMVSPMALFIFRVIAAAWAIVTRIWYGVHYAHLLEINNRFFTVISFWLLLAYFVFIVAASLRMKSYKWSTNFEEESEDSYIYGKTNLIRFCKFVNIVFEVVIASVTGVVLVFWILIFDKNNISNLAFNILLHGINLPFVYVDLFLSRTHIHPAHVLYMLLWLILYMFAGWIIHAETGEWVYVFLDYNLKTTPAYYIGILIVFALMFYWAYALCKLRDRVAKRINDRDEATYYRTNSRDVTIVMTPQ